MEEKLNVIDSTTELLQYFNGSTVITQADSTYTATGIGTGLSVGDIVVISGAGQSGSNGTFVLTAVASGAITVAGTIGTNETATVTINQEYTGEWKEVRNFAVVVTTITSTGSASLKIDQSGNGYTVDITTTTAITGGTAATASLAVALPFARLRVTNNGADQTTLRAYMCGRTGT